MAESILLQRYVRRSHLAEELVEQWRDVSNEGMQDLDLEDLVCECLELGNIARRSVNSLLDQLFDEKLAPSTIHSERLVRSALARCRRAFGALVEMIERAKSQGRSIAGARDLLEAHNEVHRLEAQVESALPPFDVESRKQADEEMNRGEGSFVEDTLARTQGQNSSGGEQAH